MRKSLSFLLFLFLVLPIVFTLILSGFSEAIPPEIYSITPNTGGNVTPTQVTIEGSGFEPAPKIALYGGGPYITGSCDTPDRAWGVHVSGSYAYVADWFSGLQVIDISDPANPRIAGACTTPGTARGVHVSGSYAYVADRAGLQVIDISNPANPRIVGTCDTPGEAVDVHVSGSYAYVADGFPGFQVIDISDPANPCIVGTCDTLRLAWGVHVSGSYAYVADYIGLQVIDISNPANPRIVGSCDTPYEAWDVYVSGSYAYVADNDFGLQVIDISNPANPRIAGECYTLNFFWARGVHVSGSYAYVADWLSGLQVIDISDPANPRIAGACDTPSKAHGVHVTGDYAYVADSDFGLQVIDISNPSNPRIVGTCDTPGEAHGVHVTGGYAYVADSGSGLQVIEKFKSFTYIEYIDSNIIKAVIPAGFRPGAYNLHVTNPDDGHTVLYNAFTVQGESMPDLCLLTGLNIFSYPVDVPQGYTSYDLILSLGTEDEIIKIQKYDPNTKAHSTTTSDPSGVPRGYDFNILNGEGYLVYMKTDKSVSFDGFVIIPGIRLAEGPNIVSIPYVPSGYTSYDLLLYLGSPEEIAGIQRFNCEKGIFETTAYNFGRPSGTKFNIVNGEGYLIYMKVDKQMDAPQ